MRTWILAALAAVTLSAQAQAANFVYVPEMEMSPARMQVTTLFAAVETSTPREWWIGRVKNGGIQMEPAVKPFLSMATIFEVATSHRCGEKAAAGHGCLVNIPTGTVYVFTKRNHDGSVDVYQRVFNGDGLSSGSDLLSEANAGVETVYTLQKARSHQRRSHGWCGLEADVHGHSFHLIIGGQRMTGTGSLNCVALDGTRVSQRVQVVAEGPGLGLGLSGFEGKILATGIGYASSVSELYGTYAIADGGIFAGVIGLAVGTGFHATKGSLVIPMVLELKWGLGLEVAVNFNKVSITPID